MRRTSSIATLAALSFAGLLAVSAAGCGEQTTSERIDEAVEEVQDEAGDLKDDFMDEVDDRT